MKKNSFTPIENIIAIAKRGGMFILVDDEKRENEGDLIISSSDCNAKNINFMAKYGRGLICLAKQIKPLPYFAIKFIFLALQSDEDIIKSPSFSLFSSSTKINMPPLLAMAIMFSIGVKLFFFIKIISNVFR